MQIVLLMKLLFPIQKEPDNSRDIFDIAFELARYVAELEMNSK